MQVNHFGAKFSITLNTQLFTGDPVWIILITHIIMHNDSP